MINTLTNIESDSFESLDLARGYFENIDFQNGLLTVSGWMISIRGKIESVRLYLNDSLVSSNEIKQRSDVKDAYKNWDHAEYSGFDFRLEIEEAELNQVRFINIIGCRDGIEINKIGLWFNLHAFKNSTIPPKHLMFRVSNTEDAMLFLISGMKNFGEYWQAISKYVDTNSIRNMLDWGCGCGRMVNLFSINTSIEEFRACDVDSEAIEWCKGNIESVDFSTIPFYPPTSYQDNSFDLIISYSIFTHLTKENQALWLQEMKRILAPGGYFLTSIHGDIAAKFCFPASHVESILESGIYDGHIDNTMDGVVPNEYYRATFQSKEYTYKEWSKYFTIVEYIGLGAGNFQDLIVMRK